MSHVTCIAPEAPLVASPNQVVRAIQASRKKHRASRLTIALCRRGLANRTKMTTVSYANRGAATLDVWCARKHSARPSNIDCGLNRRKE